MPTPAVERAVIVPSMTRTPGPAPGECAGALEIGQAEGAEGEYVRQLFSVRELWRSW
jgi:hypothetical protein